MTAASPLPPGQAHLWFAPVEDAYDEARLRAWRTLLCPAEIERHDRFRFDASKREFLITRVLVRSVLSRYTGVAPESLTFEPTRHGRPELRFPELDLPLRFNLSNTFGLVVCLVSGEHEGGVDIEDTTRRGKTIEIADRFFAPSEVAALRTLPAHAQRDRFFDYWTLKEAYIKARGMGLALPLEQFAFAIDGAHIRIHIDPRLEDDEGSWEFSLFSPTPRYRVAVALRGVGLALQRFDADLSLPSRGGA